MKITHLGSPLIVLLVCLQYLGLYALVRADSEAYEEEEVEYEYEYEYEEGDPSEIIVGQSTENTVRLKPSREIYYGFHRNPGGGLMKIKKMLVDESYLNETAGYYDCVKRADAWILALEPDPADYDEEVDLAQQIASMKKKVEAAVQAANVFVDSLGGSKKAPEEAQENPAEVAAPAEAQANATAPGEIKQEEGKGKRLSFREKQDLRMKLRREKEAQREQQRPKFRLGAACETLICGSCKAVISEFAHAVHRAVNSSEVRYVEQVVNTLCSSKEITQKYTEMVIDICSLFQEETLGYKEALVMRFEAEEDWELVNTYKNIYLSQQSVCTAVGACTEKDFTFQSAPELRIQEQWDEKCFVCQAFAFDLEERVQLSKHVTERSIVPMVAETCNRLQLKPEYDSICREMTQGKLLDDISWLAKVHGESVSKKAKGELKFSDKLCEEIDWCKPWVEPEKLKEKKAQESMEAVFF